ncbi:hypothetical protein NC651_008383 [Populus alba x Populus x berolinensis]|nr:hypothetical protein NC651_008383 [Populus alba x Populus x berolinensis]
MTYRALENVDAVGSYFSSILLSFQNWTSTGQGTRKLWRPYPSGNLTRDTRFDGYFDILVATIKRSIELTGPISQDRIIQILVGTNQ